MDSSLKTKRYSFTAWTMPNLKSHLLDYLIWCEEYTPSTGLLHFQGYVEFKKEYNIKYVKSLFKSKNIHLEASRESRSINRSYCLKNGFNVRSFEYNGGMNNFQNNITL